MKRLILVVLLGLVILISGCFYPQRMREMETELITIRLKTENLEFEREAEKVLVEYQQQAANQKKIANNLALSLSQLNALIENQNLVQRINTVLINNGYRTLIRQEEVVSDSLK